MPLKGILMDVCSIFSVGNGSLVWLYDVMAVYYSSVS
jgi:hypothetical protein